MTDVTLQTVLEDALADRFLAAVTELSERAGLPCSGTFLDGSPRPDWLQDAEVVQPFAAEVAALMAEHLEGREVTGETLDKLLRAPRSFTTDAIPHDH